MFPKCKLFKLFSFFFTSPVVSLQVGLDYFLLIRDPYILIEYPHYFCNILFLESNQPHALYSDVLSSRTLEITLNSSILSCLLDCILATACSPSKVLCLFCTSKCFPNFTPDKGFNVEKNVKNRTMRTKN